MKLPYLIVWTGPRTGLQELRLAWSVEAARVLAQKWKGCRIFKLKVDKEVE